MRIKEITVGGSRTINLGNYNSIKIEGNCTVEFSAGEEEDIFIEAARNMAIDEVKVQLKHAYANLKPPVKE